jgi:CRISPR/Cas system CMR subunit Cmr4 (Cas7 group RAMP superfamily)
LAKKKEEVVELLGNESVAMEQTEEIEFTEPEEKTEEAIRSEEEVFGELDWKEAARHLKLAVEDQSIDRYSFKEYIERLRVRYNDKERTKELYDAIMAI